MRKLILFMLLAVIAASAQQSNTDFIPATTGLNLGHTNQRWNGNFQNVNITGNCTVKGLSCITGFPTTCTVNQTFIYNGTVWVCANTGTGTVTSINSGTGLTGGPITGSGTLSLLTSCSNNQVLQWNGSSWVCANAGASLTGTGFPVVVSNVTSVSATNIPPVDVRLFFTNPFPTYAQAQSQDFGAVLNAALVAATPTGQCVDVSGMNVLNAPNVATYYATTNIFAGLVSNTYVPCIIGWNFTLVTGVTQSTPIGAIRLSGSAPPGIGGTGFVIQPCNTTGGCSNGSGGVSVTQFPTSATCASSGGTNCWATGLPSSGALTTYNTGTVTYNTGSKTVTGSGTTWTSAMVGGTFVSSCPSNSCTVGSTSNYSTGRIVAASATSITLDVNWSGTLGSGSAGQNYVIFKPNTAVAWCDGCLGNGMQHSFTGHEIDNLIIDLNGISGAGFYTKSSQEGSILNNFGCSLQGGSPTGATAGGTCLAWDQSIRESSAGNQTFLGHWSVYGGRIGVGNNAAGSSAFGVVIEGFSVMDGSVGLSQGNGPSVFELQAIIGGSGGARFQDDAYIDGVVGMFVAGTHTESSLNDHWNVGPVNPSYNISFNNITSSGTLGNAVVELHSGTSGNSLQGVSRPSGGILAIDGATTIATSSSGTPASWTLVQYNQAGNGGIGFQTSGETQTAASTTTQAGLNIPHGSAPTSPTNGDFWSTTSGFFGRVNGSTVGPFNTGGGSLSGMSAGGVPLAATSSTVTSSTTPGTNQGTYILSHLNTVNGVATATTENQAGDCTSPTTITGAATTGTVLYSDVVGCTVRHDIAASQSATITLPTPTTLNNAHPFFVYENDSTHADTLTPTTFQISLANTVAASTLAIPGSVSCKVAVDPTNASTWKADCHAIATSGGGVTSVNTLTGAVVIEAATSGQMAVSGGSGAALTGAADMTYTTHTFATTTTGIFDWSAATGTNAFKFPPVVGGSILAGTSTANLSAPIVIQNTNSSNNNTSITMGITAPGTSTGQTILNVNGATTSGDLLDVGTGGTWTNGVLSGQTKQLAVDPGGSLYESTYTGNSTTGSITVNANKGAYQTITLSGNLTIAFTQPAFGTTILRLKITQAAGGSDTVTWTSVKWPGGIAPVMTAAANAIDWYSCVLDGTNTWCTAGQNFQ